MTSNKGIKEKIRNLSLVLRNTNYSGETCGFANIIHNCLSYLCMLSPSVLSDSLQPNRLWPTRLLYPWNFLGKKAGEQIAILFQGILLTQELNQHLLHWQ